MVLDKNGALGFSLRLILGDFLAGLRRITPMVDKYKVAKKLGLIRTCLDRLESLGRAGREEFLADFRLADAAKHNLRPAPD